MGEEVMTKILIDRATAEQALNALENVNPSLVCEMAHHPKKDQHGIGQKCPLEIRHLETITAIKEVLAQPVQPVQKPVGEVVEVNNDGFRCKFSQHLAVGTKLYATPSQQQAEYDMAEMNSFVIDLYDKKMQEGKHGHYETMFYVVHQAIKRASPHLPVQPERQPLTVEEIGKAWSVANGEHNASSAVKRRITRAIEAAHNIKENT